MNTQEFQDEIIITLPFDFNLSANLGYLSRNTSECMYEVENAQLIKVIVIHENRYLVRIHLNNHQQMVVHLLNRPLNKWEKAGLINYIREWFDLDTDLTQFYEIAQTDQLLHIPVQEHYGLRIIGLSDFFEAICWGIIGQQINLTFAYTLKRRFVEKFGESIEWQGKKFWIFPTCERIAQLTPPDLTDMKMTLKKSEYIIEIAQLLTRGALSKEQLKNLNYKEAEKTLIKIRGIGPWTANYVLMRCLRFKEAFPIDDVGLINSIKTLQNMDRKPTKEEILKLAHHWKHWESYATFYLWRILY
ncbi:DNA-3-methyladenine glycosylase 2 [Cytobacillus sp. Hz8]|uniref:DNA-3-methyladenine glycosylase 2 n=1 Tax=Cytobacillus sp. Hz8 TaxID=3347168 RepID=UPI0035D72C57